MPQALELRSLSLQDALDLAILLEEEARARYREYAGMMGQRLATQASGMFHAMAAGEARHAAQLAARRRALFADAPRRVDPGLVTEVEAPDARATHVLLSPREAVEAALVAEERSHGFYAAALPLVRDPEVRALFSEIAAAEERHEAFLRELLRRVPDAVEDPWVEETGSDPGS
ncbi:ferritin family protein [Anaeromyxobacter paludicola]|uniref:Rubrerythrin diiron-binding domain-containing protein n=1 Tax=Anaeromyxobacter paludicola TaxID=2918171 RepID=A0ABN6N2N5_9BACT|nr:ferritin family protein [Anaeromyxobacter paludicola]BDG07326.1 hypothetical protein AMPC_04390 [Anaeromyxobacter paludicola]